jgi:hypothetical protein
VIRIGECQEPYGWLDPVEKVKLAMEVSHIAYLIPILVAWLYSPLYVPSIPLFKSMLEQAITGSYMNVDAPRCCRLLQLGIVEWDHAQQKRVLPIFAVFVFFSILYLLVPTSTLT